MTHSIRFSTELERWLKGGGSKTFQSLRDVFGERSFAVVFFVFMALPALPIPTGGVTHVLEILTMLIALQPIVGMKRLWIPSFLAEKELPEGFVKKALPLLIRRVRWFEKYSRPRGSKFVRSSLFSRLAGLCILALALAAFTAIPFSGLDTLPAIGAVLIAMALIEGDFAYFIAGLVVGATGVLLSLTVGVALFEGIKRFLRSATPLQIGLAAAVGVVLVVWMYVRHKRRIAHNKLPLY